MANIIHAAPSKIISTAGNFENLAGEVKGLTSNMTAAVQQLTGRIWSGEAAGAYKGKFNSLQGDINRLYEMIRTHSQQLIAIAREFENAETMNASEASGLSFDVIV